jgi:hypothetical protein
MLAGLPPTKTCALPLLPYTEPGGNEDDCGLLRGVALETVLLGANALAARGASSSEVLAIASGAGALILAETGAA